MNAPTLGQLAVVIPTRNRPRLLARLLGALAKQTLSPTEVLVVDSSDPEFRPPDRHQDLPLTWIDSPVRSAAVQRNIGLEQVLTASHIRYIAFLDDDVLPADDYLERLAGDLLRTPGAVGASGIPLIPGHSGRFQPQGPRGILRRLACLDSKRDGVLLSSGVNISVSAGVEPAPLLDVDWLIGCSVWDLTALKDIRFENDFMGYSLGEDVVLSVRARQHGRLLVDPTVHLHHDADTEGRPSPRHHWRLWVRSRRRIVGVDPGGRLTAYWWANVAALVLFSLAGLAGRPLAWESARGIWDGMKEQI